MPSFARNQLFRLLITAHCMRRWDGRLPTLDRSRKSPILSFYHFACPNTQLHLTICSISDRAAGSRTMAKETGERTERPYCHKPPCSLHCVGPKKSAATTPNEPLSEAKIYCKITLPRHSTATLSSSSSLRLPRILVLTFSINRSTAMFRERFIIASYAANIWISLWPLHGAWVTYRLSTWSATVNEHQDRSGLDCKCG